MRIAIAVSIFPAISETFVIDRAVQLLSLGHDVTIQTRKLGDGFDHPDVAQFGLPQRTYLQPRRSWNPRTPGTSLSSWVRLALSSLRITAAALNPLQFGRHATSGRVLFEVLPWLDSQKRHGAPDVVLAEHAHSGNSALRLRQAGAIRCPIVTVVHGSDVYTAHPGKFDRLFAEGDLFLPVSESLRERLIELGCSEQRIIVHPNGVNLKRFAWRRRSLKTDEPLRLLSVARLVDFKGLEYAIRAIPLIRAALDRPVHYTIYGDGPLRGELAHLIQTCGVTDDVDLAGAKPVSEVVVGMSNSHILLSPSIITQTGGREGFGVVIIEAMASGLPVIATCTGGIVDIIRDGVDGLLVNPCDPEGIAHRVLTLANDPEMIRKLSIDGRRRVEESFDAATLSERLSSILQHTGYRST